MSNPLETGGLDGYGQASEETYEARQDGKEFVVGRREGGDVPPADFCPPHLPKGAAAGAGRGLSAVAGEVVPASFCPW